MKILLNAALALFATSALVSFACSTGERAPDAEPAASVPAVESTQESRPVPEPVQRPAYDATHGLWTEILAEHVKGDNFDYAALKKKPERLERYLDQLHSVSKSQYDKWKENEQMAFWINVYNAHAIKLVIDHYPVDSIRDIGTMLNRVWNKRFIDLQDFEPEGKERQLSLDDVEHKILRPTFQDARVHAAVNCASESCPPLRAEAFTAKKRLSCSFSG